MKQNTAGFQDYFIKLDVPVDMKEFEQSLKRIQFDEAPNNIMRTISKNELNRKINELL